MWRIEQPNSFSPEFQRSGQSGFYLEVLQEGEIAPGDEVRHEPTQQASISVPDFARFFMQAKKSVEELERLMNTEGMGTQMLDALTAELNRQIDKKLSSSHRWQGWRRFVIEKVVQESGRVKSFYLAPEDGLPVAGYRAGQFLNVRLTVPVDKSTTEIVRSWSISSYDEACQKYRISIKREPGGHGSGYMHDQIREGDVIEILAPAGRFVLERGESDKPAVLISAGIGITPMLSMLNSHAARRDKILPTLYFIHSTQNQETEAFREEVESVVAKHDEIQSHFIHTKPSENSRPSVDYDSSGRLNIEQLKRVLADMQSWFSGAYVPVPPMYCRFYICGPDAFQKSLVLMLEELGVPAEQVHQETFHPTEEDLSAELAEAKVIFSKSGSENIWQPDENLSLLELAEEAGLAPTFGCRSGTCGLCSTPLTKGEVSYSRKPSIEVPEGKILLCSTRPVGDIEVTL
jgi:ferredoxin-NADP reductase